MAGFDPDNTSADDYFLSQGLVLNADKTEWVKPWVDSTPVPLQNPDVSPAEIAAYKTARAVTRKEKQPVMDDRGHPFGPINPEAPSYLVEPDLQETQAGMQLPSNMYQDAGGSILFNNQSPDKLNQQVPIAKRPGLLPITATPEGYKVVMPRMLDIVGNVMGNVAAPKVAAKAGEMVLGSGIVRKETEALKHAEPFYSQLERSVENAKINLATPEQWLGYLRNTPGVKSEEINTVLKDLPKDGMLSKEQLGEFVKQNKVELKEKVLGDNKQTIEKLNELQPALNKMLQENDRLGFDSITDARKAIISDHPKAWEFNKPEDLALAEQYHEIAKNSQKPTKYHSYQLPGGENYKETLLSLPDTRLKYTKENVKPIEPYNDPAATNPDVFWYFKTPDNVLQIPKSKYKTEEAALEYIIKEKVGNEAGSNNYKAPHFDEHGENLLVHIRHNDRNIIEPGYSIKNIKSGNVSKIFNTHEEALDYHSSLPNSLKPDTKITSAGIPKKSLHLEEVQSDWHQKGRKEGYKITPEQSKKLDEMDERIMNGLPESIIGDPDMKVVLNAAVDKKLITADEAKNYVEWSKGAHSTVPDAPFKKTWDELALKRMIHKAANEGYDAISWTPGEAQAARYDLSKQLDSIKVYKDEKGNFKIYGKKPNGREFEHLSSDISPQKLEDVVGKELAQKIIDRDKTTKPYKPLTELPEEYHLIHDSNGKKNKQEWGIIPPNQSHAGSYTGRYHATEKEAVDAALARINSERKDIYDTKNSTFENVDLKIGGEGMKGFYDKILVDRANALGKKYGSKVEQKNINQNHDASNNEPFSSMDKARDILKRGGEVYGVDRHGHETLLKNSDEVNNTYRSFIMGDKQPQQSIHYLSITPELRQKAKEGFPLFSSSPTLIPVDHDPFKEDKKSKVKLTPVVGNPFQ